jgi:hypothetical protein
MISSHHQSSLITKNAGLVIAHQYIPVLFERLGLMRDNKFISETAQLDAVNYLQYVTSGKLDRNPDFMSLNKVLCGLPLNHPVPAELVISKEHKELIDGMIKAMINAWPVFDKTSVQGFRSAWFLRRGVVIDWDGEWRLWVDKASYDMLLHQSPYSFAVVNTPGCINQ